MKNLKVKDLIYSNNTNKFGFITMIRTEHDGITYYDIQHPFEISDELTKEENYNKQVLEQSVALGKDLLKFTIG